MVEFTLALITFGLSAPTFYAKCWKLSFFDYGRTFPWSCINPPSRQLILYCSFLHKASTSCDKIINIIILWLQNFVIRLVQRFKPCTVPITLHFELITLVNHLDTIYLRIIIFIIYALCLILSVNCISDIWKSLT